MITVVEALDKTKDKLQLGWNKEPEAVASYKLYAGLSPIVGAMTLLKSDINPQVSEQPGSRRKVTYEAQIADVRTALSLSAAIDFTNITLYWTLTWVDAAGTESPIADSTIVEIPPVGIDRKTRKDDPTVNRFMYGFSDEIYRWVKMAASSNGGLAVDTSDYYKANITTEYTYDGTNLATAKSYLSDRTVAGSPAKLTTYTYSGSDVIKVVVTDSTV